MEHLDNDMDDLFQKAGELYPLKTTGSDWDAVAGKLRDESFSELNAAPGLTSRGSRNKRRWLLLLLLILLGFGIAYTSGLFTQKNGPSFSDKKSSVFDKTNSRVSKPIIENKTVAIYEGKINKVRSEKGIRAGISSNFSGANPVAKKGMQSLTIKTKDHKSNAKGFATQNIIHTQNQPGVAGAATKTGLNSEKEFKRPEENQITNPDKSLNAAPPAGAKSDPLKPAALVIPAAVTKENEKELADKKADSAVFSKAVSADSSLTKKKSIAHSKHLKGFYLGLLVGPDISTVKLQSVKQLGFSAGILVGFRFNNRFAIETGFIWDQKYYYTSGEYFKSNMPYPPNSSVNGHCDMIEIPLLVRYDFATSKNHGFFAKAGLSSYLMTHQYYSKKVNGQDYGSWPVTQQQNFYFSVAQVSAGYEFSINGKTKIQIEPYLKIPLQGLGEGSLPISSTGIYFGITRSFR